MYLCELYFCFLYTCQYSYVCICAYLNIYVYIYIHMYIYIYKYINISIYIYTYIYMSYIYIYVYLHVFSFLYNMFVFCSLCSPLSDQLRRPGLRNRHRHWIWKTWVHLGWARSCDLAASLVEFCGVSQAHKQKQTKKITVAIRSVQHPMQRFVCTVRIWIVQFISCLRLCTFSTSVCVCVWNHLNRCKTSLGFLFWFHFNTQGDVAEHQDHAQRSYLTVWNTEPDQLWVPACLNPFSAVKISRQWPLAKPRIGTNK